MSASGSIAPSPLFLFQLTRGGPHQKLVSKKSSAGHGHAVGASVSIRWTAWAALLQAVFASQEEH
jgi:hypothetical protein